MNIIAVGDIVPGGVLNGLEVTGVSCDIEKKMSQADVVVGTLETAVGNIPSFFEEKMKRLGDVIYVEDQDLFRLKKLHVDIVSLANNHFYDLGYEGAIHTLNLLDQLGIKYCGAGRNIEEASKPVVIEEDDETFAFIAFCDWHLDTVGWCPIATEDSPGVNPMYEDHVISEIKKYAVLYDNVIVIPHWGKEYSLWPLPEVYRLSKKMVAAGAKLVLGSHTHCVQPILQGKDFAVVYSMGNFLFPDRLITKPRSTYYPHPALDYEKLPKTDGYPYVEKPTFKLWKPIARVGMIVNCDMKKGVRQIEKYYTYLTNENDVVIHKNQKNKKLSIVSFLLRLRCYPYMYKLYFFCVRVKNKMERIL